MILLYSEHDHGEAALPASLIEGFEARARRYRLVDHLMVVDGGGTDQPGADAIARADAGELLAHGYRLATSAEQDAYHAARRRATSVHEDTASPGKSKARNGG